MEARFLYDGALALAGRKKCGEGDSLGGGVVSARAESGDAVRLTLVRSEGGKTNPLGSMPSRDAPSRFGAPFDARSRSDPHRPRSRGTRDPVLAAENKNAKRHSVVREGRGGEGCVNDATRTAASHGPGCGLIRCRLSTASRQNYQFR